MYMGCQGIEVIDVYGKYWKKWGCLFYDQILVPLPNISTVELGDKELFGHPKIVP